MAVIDADAHVVETEHTWDYMDPSDAKFRPALVGPVDGRFFWMCDGKIRRPARDPLSDPELEEQTVRDTGRNVGVSRAARYMENIGVRLRHMDELGIDMQVLHNTIFIEQIADRPEAEVAVCRGYNRWLADIYSQSDGRLRWVPVLPYMVMDEALKELRTSVEHGGCGAAIRPIEGNRLPTDPYFYPVYEEASRLNVPIVLHIANANPGNLDLVSQYNGAGAAAFWRFNVPTVASCHAIIASEIPELFPNLKFSFVEAGAQWVPYVVADLKRRRLNKKLPDNPLKEYGIYVTCQTSDDLPWVLKYSGEDNLVIGTDYGHTDTSSEIEAIRNLKNIGDVSPEVIDKILDDNPRALHNL